MLIRSDVGSVEAYVYYVDGVARSWGMMNGTGLFEGFRADGVYWNNADGTIYHEGVYRHEKLSAKKPQNYDEREHENLDHVM